MSGAKIAIKTTAPKTIEAATATLLSKKSETKRRSGVSILMTAAVVGAVR
jgi:hypothetical protein